MFKFLDSPAQRFAMWSFGSWQRMVVFWIVMVAMLCVSSWGIAEILVGTNAVHLPKLAVTGIVLGGWVTWMAGSFVGAVVHRLRGGSNDDEG